jgi:hypothetical protein
MGGSGVRQTHRGPFRLAPQVRLAQFPQRRSVNGSLGIRSARSFLFASFEKFDASLIAINPRFIAPRWGRPCPG